MYPSVVRHRRVSFADPGTGLRLKDGALSAVDGSERIFQPLLVSRAPAGEPPAMFPN